MAARRRWARSSAIRCISLLRDAVTPIVLVRRSEPLLAALEPISRLVASVRRERSGSVPRRSGGSAPPIAGPDRSLQHSSSIHHVQDAVDCLVAARPQDGGPQDLLRL